MKKIYNVRVVIYDQNGIVMIEEEKRNSHSAHHNHQDEVLKITDFPGGKRDKKHGHLQSVQEAAIQEVKEETGADIIGDVQKLFTVDKYDIAKNVLIKTTYVAAKIAEDSILKPQDPDGNAVKAWRVNVMEAVQLLKQSHDASRKDPIIHYLKGGTPEKHYCFERNEKDEIYQVIAFTSPAFDL